MQKDRAFGQISSRAGEMYPKHFGIRVIFMFTADGMTILLLLGLNYSLTDIYLDRNILFIGILGWLVYPGAYLGVLRSNLLVGAVFLAGFFIVAYRMSKDEKLPSGLA